MAKIVVYSMAYRGHVFPYVPIASVSLARATTWSLSCRRSSTRFRI